MDIIFPVFAIMFLVCFAGVLGYSLYHFVITWIDDIRIDDQWEQGKPKRQEILTYGPDGDPRPWDFQ